MKENKVIKKWFQGLVSGMDQATDSSLVANNESPLLKNVTLDQIGNWATRLGTNLIGTSLGTNPGYGLFSYVPTSGTRKLMAVTDRDLYALTEPSTWGAAVDTDEWPTDKRVDGVNFLNRLYLGSEDGGTPLSYTTGGAITDVTPEIGGSMLDVNKNILAVAGNDMKPEIIFYSDPFTDTFHSASGTAAANADVAGANTFTATTSIFEPDMIGSMLYNETEDVLNLITGWTSGTVVTTNAATSTWDNDTVSVLSNNFKQDNAATGLKAYGDGFVSFDEYAMYVWDPTNPDFSDKKPGFGCVNYRTVQVLEGALIWVNREGIYLWGGQGKPTDITGKIRDRLNGFGLWDLIASTNFSTLSAIAHPSKGEYRLSVGTLSTVSGAPASAMTNAELVFNIRKGTWSVNSNSDKFNAYTTFVDSNGAKKIYAIGDTDAAVWNLETGTTDDDDEGNASAIAFDFRTPHHVLGNPTVTQRPKNYFVKYISGGNVTVKVSVDRGSYETIATLPSSATVKTVEIVGAVNDEGFSHSLQFTGSTTFILEGYGFEVEEGTTTRIARV